VVGFGRRIATVIAMQTLRDSFADRAHTLTPLQLQSEWTIVRPAGPARRFGYQS
jgi:hypothetical protein